MDLGPRKQPRQRRSRDTVVVILEAAAQVFDREGVAATTNRIAERAGVSIGSVYQYFPNKQALLRALAERHLAEAGTRLGVVFDRLRAERPPFEASMRAVLDTLIDLHAERPRLHALMHRLAPRLPAESTALAAFEDHIAGEVAFHLQRCGRGGDDPELVAQTLVHAVDAHLHRVLTRREMDTDRLMRLVQALTPPPGPAGPEAP